MRHFILHILVLLVFTTAAHAHDAVVVQSLNVKPYEDLYQSFKSAYQGSVMRYILSETSTDVVRQVKEERAKVIVAIGTDALMHVRKIKDVPIIYVMVLNPSNLETDSDNITGINMVITAERQLTTFRKILPASFRRVGVLYDPSRTGGFMKKAVAAARQAGFEIVAREVSSVKDMPKALVSLKGAVDALWLLPDQTIINPETVEHLLLFGVENGLPVLSFSMKYVKMGALVSLDLDPVDLGRQAADLARKAAAGGELKEQVSPRAATPHVNGRIARKLGIALDDDSLRRLGGVRVD